MFGYCKFCGQELMFDAGDRNIEDANEEASRHCDCDGARSFRFKQQMKEAAQQNIDILFIDEYEDEAAVLRRIAELMVEGRISTASITIGKNTKAVMTRSTKGVIKVTKTITENETLES